MILDRTNFQKDKEIHTINAINTVAEIKARIIAGKSPYINFSDLYKDIYPLICRARDEDVFNDDTKEEKRIYEIVLKEPDKINDKDKAYLIKHFNTFLDLFGVGV